MNRKFSKRTDVMVMMMFVIQNLNRVRQRTDIADIQTLGRFIDSLEESS